MKKLILTLALVMSIGTTDAILASSAPKHRYQPKAEQVDDSKQKVQADEQKAQKAEPKNEDEGVEAYSDTTNVDTTDEASYQDAPRNGRDNKSFYSMDRYTDPLDYIGNVLGRGMLGFLIFICVVLFLLVVFAPIIIVVLLIRYLKKRQDAKMKLAEMAMDKGVNVPEQERPINRQSSEYLVKRGLRNTFLGLGLAVMFMIWDWTAMVGVGMLVLFYGIGQAVIGCLPQIKELYQQYKNKKQNEL